MRIYLKAGDKQGFIEATIEFALERKDLREGVLEYLEKIVDRNRRK